MPVLVTGAPPVKTGKISLEGKQKVNYRDRYPDKLDLSPDTDLHARILTEVYSRALFSRSYMSRRYSSWTEMDKTLIAYKDLTQIDTDAKAEDPTKPTAIVVPLNFATRETILTYYVSRFLTPPLFRYRGVEGGDFIKAAKLELIIDLHCFRSKVALELYSMWQDSLSYGIGAGSPQWSRHYGIGSPKDPRSILGPRMLWEGNCLEHISPYDLLPDPNVSVNKVQEGEFNGWVRHTSQVALLSTERADQRYFNCRYLELVSGRSVFQPEATTAQDRPGEQFGARPFDTICMYINLVPKEWGLGDGSYPEKWYFEVAGDSLVIRAEPLGLFYDEFPLTLCAPLFDSYSMTPVSLLERVQGMQIFGDWLINSLIWKTRKAMGVNIVYDPEAVNEWDLTAEGPVKLIRLNPTHWGRGEVSKYVHQLDVNEDSGTHLQNFTFLMDIYPRVTGANDGMQGIMKSTGERRSATEARDSFQSAVSRVQKSAKIISLQTHQDIARMFAYNVQQLMSDDQRLRITGDWALRLQEEYGSGFQVPEGALTATPDDFLDFDYDIISHDAALPGEEDRESWTQMLQPMLSNPIGFQQLGLDGRRIFLHVARQLGARDAADFIIRPPQARTMDNEQVVREEEKGNLVPLGAANTEGGKGSTPIF